MVRRVGIVGFGHLGRYLSSCIQNSETHELAFVWNRTKAALVGHVDQSVILDDLKDFASRNPDIIVEVCHPSITKAYGARFVSFCDFMVGSPTVFCDEFVEVELRHAAVNHSIYVPSGAFWGGEDIQKMADLGLLKMLKVTMKKHPLSLKLEGALKGKNAAVKDSAVVIYEGPVRDLCQLAKQNTNTMAAAAIAGHNLGFDGVQGCLVADPNLTRYHIVEVEVEGFPRPDGSCFHAYSMRRNPSVVGEVTGLATYAAYFGSLKRAKGKGPGLHLC